MRNPIIIVGQRRTAFEGFSARAGIVFHLNCIRCAVVDEVLGQRQREYKCTGTRAGHRPQCLACVCDCFNSLGGYVGRPFENNGLRNARRMLLNINVQGEKIQYRATKQATADTFDPT